MTSPLLPVSRARDAGRRLGLRSMIVLQELPDGRWGYTSWGRTLADCGRARRLADQALDMVETEAMREPGE